MSRVHVLRSPLTDYLRYQLAAYLGNTKPGESIGIIDLAEQPPPGLPDHDFWLFGNREAYRMPCTANGAFIGGEQAPARDLVQYQSYRERALAAPLCRSWPTGSGSTDHGFGRETL
ncbi:hypothetical protein OG413_16900 [Streptomyces sp. NBC_01433]|uniref:DUF6879 family protein n=1 Tax=Streptomyces sp. NBC_01433 TaxID=2903864 RepID=UPI002250D575|nr:DUF6879 family protein [Streptomyces sp. NBC_01433]MCX4676960.1 hypothetical protein [Streptomyces sp. NBC_01433]